MGRDERRDREREETWNLRQAREGKKGDIKDEKEKRRIRTTGKGRKREGNIIRRGRNGKRRNMKILINKKTKNMRSRKAKRERR